MKTIGILCILVFLTGCFRTSTVTVGQNRIRSPNVITDYSFYSHELIKYYATLPESERLGILSISKITDNKVKFTFSSSSKSENDSSIAAIFEGFCLSQYKTRFDQWEAQKEEFTKPFMKLAESNPEIFKERALEAISVTGRPIVEVYALRIE